MSGPRLDACLAQLAAGLLTGRHASVNEVAVGRFKDNPNYLPRFYTPANFAAVDAIRAACEAAGLSLVQAPALGPARARSLRTLP